MVLGSFKTQIVNCYVRSYPLDEVYIAYLNQVNIGAIEIVLQWGIYQWNK